MSLEHSFKLGLTSILRLFLRSAVSPPPDADAVESVLVIRQHNQLGDMLCVVPLLRSLRLKYPIAYLSLMASPVNFDIMEGNRYLNEVVLYDKRQFLNHGRIHFGKLLEFIRRLRSRKFTIAIVPGTVSTSFTSDIFAYLSGARCRIGAGSLNGVHNPASFLFTVPVDLDWRSSPDKHQTARNLDNAWQLGLTSSDFSLEMTLSEDEKEAGRKFVDSLRTGKKLAIGYHPGAGKAPNRWPAEKFGALINSLSAELNAAALLTCGPMDSEQIKAVENSLTVSYHVLNNQPIRQVASVLSRLDLVISNDTGIMHVAAAVGVPVLSLFGPTNPAQWAPQGSQHRYINGINGDITTITLEEVLERARSMLCS